MTKKSKRRHLQPSLPREPKMEEIMNRIGALQEEGKYEEILRVIEEAPPHLQRRPELMVARGLAHLSLGEAMEAREVLEEAARRVGDVPFVHALLGLVYGMLDEPGHAIRSLRIALRSPETLPPDVLQDVQTLYEGANDLIRKVAEEETGVSPQIMEEAFYLLEEGENAMEAEDFVTALHAARRVQRLTPNWWIPYGLELEALLLEGRLDEVIRVGTKAAEKFPDHPFILMPLVCAAFFRQQRDLAHRYAEPLKNRRYAEPPMLDKSALALGVLEDDAALFRLYELNRHLLDEVTNNTLLILTAAAANLGRWDTAQNLWHRLERRLEEEEFLLPWPLDYGSSIQMRRPGPGRSPRYPTAHLAPLLSLRAMMEIVDVMTKVQEAGAPEATGRIRKQIRRLAQQNPFFYPFLAQRFLEEEDVRYWAEMLLWTEMPEAEALLRQVAFGQYGRLADRLNVLFVLAQYGKLTPGQPVEVWDDVRGEWRTLPVPYWEIVHPPPLGDERAWSLLYEAEDLAMQKAWARAIAKAKEAIALDPAIPDAYAFIGDLHEAQKKFTEAREWFQKALEVDPQNVRARCALAHLDLREGDVQSARTFLEPLQGRTRMDRYELEEWAGTMATLLIREQDYALARFYLEHALDMDPDNPTYQTLFAVLEGRESGALDRFIQESLERYAQRRRRPIRADASLAECLDRISGESLRATARAMPVRVVYRGLRKTELIQRLTEVLTDPRWLEQVVGSLSAEERRALRDVLEAGGWMEWEAFTERYGDDLKEEPAWAYQAPQTLMGRLRMLGLLSDGTVEGKYVVLVPKELRGLLPPLLEKFAE